MTLHKYDKLVAVYKEIKERCSYGYLNTFVLVNYDVDAICSVKLLKSQFHNDGIQCQIYPVNGVESVRRAVELMVLPNPTIKNLICINCCGTIPVSQFLGERVLDIKTFIFDNHRPLNLNNMFDGKSNCRVLAEDSELTYDLERAFQSFYVEGYVTDESSSECDEEYDDPVEQEHARITRQRRRKTKVTRRENLMESYLTLCTYYGRPTCMSMLQITNQKGPCTDTQIWYAAVGLTYHYLQRNIPEATYTHSYKLLKTIIHETKNRRSKPKPNSNSNLNRSVGRGSNYPYNKSLRDLDGSGTLDPSFMDQSMSMSTSFLKVSTKLDRKDTVSTVVALKLHCLHHWSLYEALYYTPYPATKLQTWTPNGIKSLNTLLTKLGIPLKDAASHYSSLNLKVKLSLVKELTQRQSSYRMSNLSFPSFEKNVGFDLMFPLQAADAANAMDALLKITKKMVLYYHNLHKTEETVKWNAREKLNEELPFKPITKLEPSTMVQFRLAYNVETKQHLQHQVHFIHNSVELDDGWIPSFYMAYDALDNLDLMKSGIDLSKHIVKDVYLQAVDILTHPKLLRIHSSFISTYPQPTWNSDTLAHPNTLRSLGNFLQMGSRQLFPKYKLPILVVYHHQLRQSYWGQLATDKWNALAPTYPLRNRLGMALARLPQFLKVEVLSQRFAQDGFELPQHLLKEFLKKVEAYHLGKLSLGTNLARVDWNLGGRSWDKDMGMDKDKNKDKDVDVEESALSFGSTHTSTMTQSELQDKQFKAMSLKD